MQRSHVAVVLSLLTALPVVGSSGPSVLRAQILDAAPPSDRFERLETWIAAIERHVPGESDAPVSLVAGWKTEELQQAWTDLRSVISLIRDPSVRVFFAPQDWQPQSQRGSSRPRSVQILYSRAELKRIEALGLEIRARGGENRLLKRGALLHGDIGMRGPPGTAGSSGAGRLGLSRTTVFLTDGRPVGLGQDVNHFEIARRMLDQVKAEGAKPGDPPNPSGDETVRLWYLAIGMFMQNVEQLDLWHFERALEIFPKDANVLFLSGCAHEMLSTPRVQSAMRAVALPRGVNFDMGSEHDELREAEELFRRALEQQPAAVEARLRHGRVLGRLGRHKEAAPELRRAISATKNVLLLYYGHLFLGAEEEALGSRDQARESYRRASSLFTEAQSPRLALSRIEAERGDRSAAVETIQGVMAMPGDADDTRDPWWHYHIAQTRGHDSLVAELHKMFRTGSLK